MQLLVYSPGAITSSAAMVWQFILWLAIAVMLIVTELVFSAGRAPADLDARLSDEFLQLCTLLAMLGPLVTAWMWVGPFALEVAILGALVAFAGVLIRCVAMVSLSGRYLLSPIPQGGEGLVVVGPYAVVRHPGYLGLLSAFAGMGALLGGLPAIVWTLPMVWGVVRRIQLEERVLAEEFRSAYEEYCSAVRWRLIPGLF